MPKSIDVLPDRLQRSADLGMPLIPSFSYQTNWQQERQTRGDHQLREILRHMLIVREFETLLMELRSRGQYQGIELRYRGPAHLSVGQEAAAVGCALALSCNDHIFGSHRSHGEFLAKGLAAIAQLSDNTLAQIMTRHSDGELLHKVQKQIGGQGKALGENFLLFGLLSEILMLATGFNGGMGGSMHAFFTPFGSYPNNAIVGGSAGIATGAALYKRLHDEGIAVSISGDGSTGCGPVWEAMNFAAMAQFGSLWSDKRGAGLPVLFVFNNNYYAMGGQTMGETMAWDRLARIGAGINDKALHAETVDGTNPLAVADAVARKRALLLSGQGPALLDIECYRQSGHSTSDANVYRSRDEIKAWQAHDAIERYASALCAQGLLDSGALEQMRAGVAEQLYRITKALSKPAVAPPVDTRGTPTLIGDYMFNNATIDLTACAVDDEADHNCCSRLRQNAKKSRSGIDAAGQPLSPMRAITLRDGLFEAILYHLQRDQRLLVYGEECREWGGAFGVYRGLAELFPHQRVFNAPISEAAIVATAVGYAMEGGRALVELMYADFIGRAGDEIFNQLAKWQAMSAGTLTLPVVLRCSVGSKYGAQHSQDWTSLVAHVPGLKVFYPATPYDAKGLMAAALAGNDPVVFFESQRLYDTTEQFAADGVPQDYYQIAPGQPDIKKTGDDVTLLSIGPCLYAALAAAAELQSRYSLSAEVIDARSLVPFDYQTVLTSLEKTGRLLIVSEACERGSFAMTLAANISRFAFASLQAAPQVLGAPNWIVPGAEMEADYFPDSTDIVTMVIQALFPSLHDRSTDQPAPADRLALAQRGL